MAYDTATVSAAQRNINNMGYTPALVVDGKEGPKTDAAVVWARNNGASVDGESNSLAKLTDGFLLAVGVTPGGHVTGTAATTVTKSGGYPLPPMPQGPLAANVSFAPSPTPGPSFGPPLNVKPPLPAPGPTPPPPPAPVAKKPSPIPAAAGAAAGAGIGWFGFGGPLAALVGATIGGIAGFFGGKSMSPSMGCEALMEGEPTEAFYFRATLAQLAHSPAKFYRLAPRPIVNAFSQWAAKIMNLPGNAMPPALFKYGSWEARLYGRGANAVVNIYGPAHHKLRWA